MKDFGGYSFILKPNNEGRWTATLQDLLDLDIHAIADTPEEAIGELRNAFGKAVQELHSQGKELPPAPKAY